jgi:hypothetical protein
MYGLYTDCVWLYTVVYEVYGLYMGCIWLHMCSVSATAATAAAAASPKRGDTSVGSSIGASVSLEQPPEREDDDVDGGDEDAYDGADDEEKR